MLQDRRRPLWPVGVMMVPIIAGAAHSVATRSYTLQAPVYIYFFLMCMGLIIYMVRALRQYGRWLRDNFADLEHKEVWQTFIVLSIIMFLFVVYVSFSESPSHQYAMQVIIAVLICCLLWRVETLSELSVPVNDIAEDMVTNEDVDVNAPSLSMQNNIGSLLKQHCEEPQLYLQHDLTVYQLAQTIGINRLYLSQYFSSQGIPSTFLIVGSLDLFVHEDKAFVEQLSKAGVQADSFVEPGVPHSYDVMLKDSPQTIRFNDLRAKAVKKMFESEL